MGKRQKDMCPFGYWRAREHEQCTKIYKNMYEKSLRDMCLFSYCRAKESNSDCTGVNFIKVWRPTKKGCVEVRSLSRLTLKKIYVGLKG